jgi:hypothetical protein
MFSQYGKLIQKKSKDHQVFAISLENFNKIGVKTHPECVKPLDEKRVDSILIDQENIHYETGAYRLPGSLIVAAVPKKGSVHFNNNYILLDGRHRYKAAQQLSFDIDFTVEVMRFDNYDDMKEEFYRINKQQTVPLYKLKNDMEVSEAVDRITIEHPELIEYAESIKDRLTEDDIRDEIETAEQLFDLLLDITDALDLQKEKLIDEDTIRDLERETTAGGTKLTTERIADALREVGVPNV